MNFETRHQLKLWTAEFERESQAGEWLRDFNWRDIPVDWSDKCNVKNGVLGMYCFGHIYLMDLELVPQYIWSTYIHELYHRWQWTTSPIKYLIGKIYRPLIENPADRVTDAAEKWLFQVKLNEQPYNKEDKP